MPIAHDQGPSAEPRGTAGTAKSPRLTGAAFGLLGGTQMILIFALTIVTVPLPSIGREFGIGQSGLVLVSAAYGLAFSGLLLFGGRLADRYGGRRLFGLGLTVFMACSVAAAIAPTFATLVAARFAQGIGAALVAPAAVALVRALFPAPGRYGRAMATWGGLSIIGATAGTLLSGFFTTWVSWRWLFLVPVLIALLALALAPRLLPQAAPTGRAALDLPGAILATAGISLLSYGVLITEEHSWTSPAAVVPIVASLVLLCAFVTVEVSVRDPLLPLGFLADRERATALVALALTAAGTSLMFLLIVLYVQRVQDWSPFATSMAFLPYTAVLLGTGRGAGRLIASFGARRVAAAGLATSGVGALLLVTLHPQTSFVFGILPGTLLLPVGAALSFAATAVMITANASQGRSGLAGGVMNTAMEAGASLLLVLLVTVSTSRAAQLVSDGATEADATSSGYAWAFAASGAVHLLWAGVLAVAGRRRVAGRVAVH